MLRTPKTPSSTETARGREMLLSAAVRLVSWLQLAGASAAAVWRSSWPRRNLLVAIPSLLAFLLLLLPAGLAYHLYFDRTNLPDIEPFIRFELPTTGRIYDAQGKVLIELAGEYRRRVSFDEVPVILRQAILAAEDKNFFSHSGLEYRAIPRIIEKTLERTWSEWWSGGDARLLLPQGGSTLTQQLVRGYFLHDRRSFETGDTLFRKNLFPRLFSALFGVPATNKFLRKLEEARLSLWLEEEMGRRYGSKERAKREIFARMASFFYLGNGRYGYAAASQFYFSKPLSGYTREDAGEAALLAGISKSPQHYAPVSGDPRPLRRRNEILSLMVDNGYISEALARRSQAEPVRTVTPSPIKTHAPAAINHVLEELKQHGGTRFGFEDLIQGRLSIQSTLDERVQTIVNEALENGLAVYEKRHPRSRGVTQGSVVVLRNADSAILAEAGGRQVYEGRNARYSDFNRATDSLRQSGSAWKPLVYLAAFQRGLDLSTSVPDEPIEVSLSTDDGMKWISNYDNQFKGPMPIRQALAESRNTVAVWITREIGLDKVAKTARELGIRTPLKPYIASSLGASEVRLLELADAYRAIASGYTAQPHIIARVTNSSGEVLYQAPMPEKQKSSAARSLIQEGLRGVVRLPAGTAHSLDNRRDFPISVMGKTGTTNDFRDALFVGSTYGPEGITVAVRIGFDDNRSLGARETGGRTALPIFREIMLRVYQDQLLGPAPRFPRSIENGIDGYLATEALLQVGLATPPPS